MPPILPITSAATWTALGSGLQWSKYRGRRQCVVPDEGITRKLLEGEIRGGHRPRGAY